MTIEIVKLTLGPIRTNCYIVGDPATQDAIVIDPADNAPAIWQTVQAKGWTVRDILATHGHFDHIMASAALKRLTGARFRLHVLDLPLVNEMQQRVRAWIGINIPPAAAVDEYVNEGDTITVGNITLEVLSTPGHSPGHVSYVLRSEQTVFSGDVLFFGSIGRTDLPGGDHHVLMQSIFHKLLPLGDEYVVAPGHMQNTTLGYERETNPFVVDYARGMW